MEYVEGDTLANYTRNASDKRMLLPVSEIVHLFSAIGLAVDYAHQKRVPHGDLRPTKILLDKRDTSSTTIGELLSPTSA